MFKLAAEIGAGGLAVAVLVGLIEALWPGFINFDLVVLQGPEGFDGAKITLRWGLVLLGVALYARLISRPKVAPVPSATREPAPAPGPFTVAAPPPPPSSTKTKTEKDPKP